MAIGQREFTMPYGHEGAVAKRATDALKLSGRLEVVFGSTAGFGAGYYAYRVRDDGSRGGSVGMVFATEQEAWVMAAIALAVYKPGRVVLTSREYGSITTANVPCPDGSLDMHVTRHRLEIRAVEDHFEVFQMSTSYSPGVPPIDIEQHSDGHRHPTIGEAAQCVALCIADYEDAVAEDWRAAVAAS